MAKTILYPRECSALNSHPEKLPITLAITGASGAQYGLRLLECLLLADYSVYLLVSKAALMVLATETDLNLPSRRDALQARLAELYQAAPQQLQVFDREEWTAPVASGSAKTDAMIVCPCSTGTLSAVACGASNNLIERAADVAIKEGRKLILVPRETPLSAIHLEHMLKLAQLGVTILPASPGFYHRPQTVDQMVDFVVARILNQLGIEQKMLPPWGSKSSN
jgi:4-hydroxy-3-polyprenylbenzoate decarboxylase